MGSEMARLLASLLALAGIAVTCCTGRNSPGAHPFFGTRLSQKPFATKSALTSCNFDDPGRPFCDWTQPAESDGKWLRGEGQKPGASAGPPGGSPERRAYYIYPEAGKSVYLQSPDLNTNAPEVCVEFLYYMYGPMSTVQLKVEVRDLSGNVSAVWTSLETQSSAWLLGAATAQAPVHHPFKVVFSALQLETKEIQVAVDTISVRPGPCSPCVTGCDFDVAEDLCGWENPPEGDVQWGQWSGSGEVPGVGPEDDFSKPGLGSYMLLDSLDPASSGSALLKSPSVQSPGGCLSLSFYCILHGVPSGTTLEVFAAAAAAGGELGFPLLSISGETGPIWTERAVNYTGTDTIQFVLEGTYRGKPGLAVDSVQISPCEEVFAQCDFNNNLDPFCGWLSPSTNVANWTRTNQNTPTEETGPPGDYPNGEGHYIYVEGADVRPGQSVRLSSRPFCTDTDTCVEFYYYMHGIVEVETQLRVLVEGPSGAPTLYWSRIGIQSPRWLRGSVSVPVGGPQPIQVVFEVVMGRNPYLDVALDNISVRRGPCEDSGTPTPTAGSSTSTTTPAGPVVTVPPGVPTTVSSTSTSHNATTSHGGYTTTPTEPQNSTITKPPPATGSSTAGGTTTTSHGSFTTTPHVTPNTTLPGDATTSQSGQHTTLASTTSAATSQESQTTATSQTTAATLSTTGSHVETSTATGHTNSTTTISVSTGLTPLPSTGHTTGGPPSTTTGHTSTPTGHTNSTTTISVSTTGLTPLPSTGHTTGGQPSTTTGHTSTASGHTNSTTTISVSTTGLTPLPSTGHTTGGPPSTTTGHTSTPTGHTNSTTTISVSTGLTPLPSTGHTTGGPPSTTTGHTSTPTGHTNSTTTISVSTTGLTPLPSTGHTTGGPPSTTTGHTSTPTGHTNSTTTISVSTTGLTPLPSTGHTTGGQPSTTTGHTSTASGHTNSTTTISVSTTGLTPLPSTGHTTGGPPSTTTGHTSTATGHTNPTTTISVSTGHTSSSPSSTTTDQANPNITTSTPGHASSLTTTSSHATPSSNQTTPSHASTVTSHTSATWTSTASPIPTHPDITSTPGHSQPSTTGSIWTSSQTNFTTTTTASSTSKHPPSTGHANATAPSPGTTTTRGTPTTPGSSQGSTSDNNHTSPVTSPVSTPSVTSHGTATTPHAGPATTTSVTNLTTTTVGGPEISSTGIPVGPETGTAATAKPTSTATASPGSTTGSPAQPPDHAICTVYGDPHYTTYDGRLFHFMGTCTYLLSALCNATSGLPPFRVEATNEHRGANTQVSYIKSVSVDVYGSRIALLKGRRVNVNDQRVTLPVAVAGGQVSVRFSGTFVLVQTDFGLRVRFDGNHQVDISVPSNYSEQLCGLCGNYNGNASDDNIMPNGTSAGADPNRLGESWQVPGAGDLGCTNTGNPGECDKDVAAEAQKPINCGMLTDPQGPFAPCHSLVPPEGPFKACVYDFCGTGGDPGSLCFALQAYADRCAQAGVTVAWRDKYFCPLNCPPGSSYTPCGPACQATCMEPASRNSCPGLPCVESCICDDGYVLSGDRCVPLRQCGCTDPSGQYHPVGESWMGNSHCTQRCTCDAHNTTSCQEWSCSPVQECRPQEGLLGCQDTGVAACLVSGDPHYYTFDGTMVSFMGTCTYTLVTVCRGGPHLPLFNVTAKNEERGQPEASYLRFVTVEVAGATVTLQKSRRVLIDGRRVGTPVEGRIPGVSIATVGIYTVLETNFGLVVKFDGNHHLEIQLPGTYFDKVCGMCGSFNNQSQDDLLMPDGHLAANDPQFGNSWKAPGDADPGCQPDDREDLNPKCTQQEMERLRVLCHEILEPKYQACHGVIDPQPFIRNCLYDLCEYQGMASVLCDNVQGYVAACQSQGVAGLTWRNSTFCPLQCPLNSHYTTCASPCPATCSNHYATASCNRSMACVEGCACDRGYVLSDDRCILTWTCGCLDNDNQYHGPGDSWVTVDCRQRCTCSIRDNIECHAFQCPSGSSCMLSTAGLRYCQAINFHQCVISGDPHYRTFDRFVHHFQGRAAYALTRTLDQLPVALEPLSVAGRNRRRFPWHRFSFLREVYVSVYGYRITLMQGRKAVVNGVKVTPPFHSSEGLQITQRGRSLVVRTDFGFSVSFDGNSLAEITLPSTYQDHVGGLCGNYDGKRQNEYMKPDRTWTRSLNAFGNSWEVSVQAATLGQQEREAGSHARVSREEPSDDVETGFELNCSPEQLALVNGTEACGALSDPQGPFAACHAVIPPDTFQESCVYDLCALSNDTELLCQDYEAYTLVCQEEEVVLGLWRQKTGCELSCPPHTTYKPCMSSCPASCANLAAPSDCSEPCVEGCASDAGYTLSGLDSVPYSQCGCTNSDQYYQINDTFFTENCSQLCTCRDTGLLECEAAGCIQGQLCAVANYTRGCFRASPCLSNPCQNEGTCQDSSDGFVCHCLEGYVGLLCEEAPLDLTPSPPPLDTSPPPLDTSPVPPPKDNHLTAILVGVLVPLGIILIIVAIVCVCRRKNKKKLREDHVAVLSAQGQPEASPRFGNKLTRF